MKKTLYSLVLSDDVVREVDILAHRNGTNRSNLINQILAEYVNLTTPERRINDVFQAIEAEIGSAGELVPFFAPNNLTMSLKSCLEYKYRPTVKYEVELYKNGGDSIGELSVIFRTQSAALISDMTEFFHVWKAVEDKILPKYGLTEVEYSLYDNKFVRSISAVGDRDCTAEELAAAISGYIELFDGLMKGCLAGRMSANDCLRRYQSYIEKQSIII